MSTQVNTLPAIRALLWERWRVMRWVVPVMLLLLAPLTVMLESGWFYAVGDYGDRPVPSFMLGLLVAASMFFHGASKGYSLSLPPHLLRAPMSSRRIAYAQLAQVLFSSLLLSSIFAAFVMPLTRPEWIACIGFVMSTVSLALGVYAVVALSALAAPVVVVAILLLTGACFVLPAWLTGTEMGAVPHEAHATLLLGWAPCVATAAAMFPIGAALLSHARSTHGGEQAGVPFARPNIFQRRGPRNHPFLARVWYEWSVWGWKFVGTAVGLTVLAGVLQRVADEHAASYASLNSPMVALGAGAIFALVMPLMDTGKLGAGKPNLIFLAPVRLSVLVSARVSTVILCAVAVSILGLMFEFAATLVWGGNVYRGEVIFTIFTIPVIVLMMVAFIPLAFFILLVLAVSLGSTLVSSVWLYFGVNQSYRYVPASSLLFEYYPLAVGALCAVAAIWCAGMLIRRRRIRVYAWLLIALTGPGYFALMNYTDNGASLKSLTDSNAELALVFLSLAALPVLGIAWQGVWLDWCRHGGLGWRWGGEKWGQ